MDRHTIDGKTGDRNHVVEWQTPKWDVQRADMRDEVT